MERKKVAPNRSKAKWQSKGISSRFKIDLTNASAESRREILNQFAARSGFDPLVDEIEKAAIKYLVAHGLPGTWPAARTAAVEKFGELSTAWFATEMFLYAGGVRDCIRKGNVKLAAELGFKLGAAWKEWKSKAEHERDAMHGKRALQNLDNNRRKGNARRTQRASIERDRVEIAANNLWIEMPFLRGNASETARQVIAKLDLEEKAFRNVRRVVATLDTEGQ